MIDCHCEWTALQIRRTMPHQNQPSDSIPAQLSGQAVHVVALLASNGQVQPHGIEIDISSVPLSLGNGFMAANLEMMSGR